MKWSWNLSTNKSGRTTLRVRKGRVSVDVLRFNWKRALKGGK